MARRDALCRASLFVIRWRKNIVYVRYGFTNKYVKVYGKISYFMKYGVGGKQDNWLDVNLKLKRVIGLGSIDAGLCESFFNFDKIGLVY